MIELTDRTQLEPPESLVQRIRDLGGINAHGEPNFRIIWGWKRLAWHGGKFHDRDGSGNLLGVRIETRLEPKYSPPNRWYFEAWLPAEAYGTPESWDKETVEWIDGVRVETLGPFPRKGDYEQVMVLQTPLRGGCKTRGACYCGGCLEFAPLTETAAMAILDAVKMSRTLPGVMKRLAREERQKQAAKEREERALGLLEEKRPAFSGPMVVVPGESNPQKLILPS